MFWKKNKNKLDDFMALIERRLQLFENHDLTGYNLKLRDQVIQWIKSTKEFIEEKEEKIGLECLLENFNDVIIPLKQDEIKLLQTICSQFKVDLNSYEILANFEITSGGNRKENIDNGNKYKFPETNNLHGFLLNEDSLHSIGMQFHMRNWFVRKSSWNELEIENAYCQIRVFGSSQEFTFTGLLDSDMMNEFKKELNFMRIEFKLD